MAPAPSVARPSVVRAAVAPLVAPNTARPVQNTKKMGLIGLATAHLGKSVSEYELVQLLENAARDTLNAIGAGAAAESALNAQRHKKLLESGAVVAVQILDVEGAALGAASTATQAPARSTTVSLLLNVNIMTLYLF